MTETKPLRDYSAFKYWLWERISPTAVRIWTTDFCIECNVEGVLNEYTIQEENDIALMASKVTKAQGIYAKQPRVRIPFAGGPCLCDLHYDQWLKGKVLPSVESVYG